LFGAAIKFLPGWWLSWWVVGVVWEESVPSLALVPFFDGTISGWGNLDLLRPEMSLKESRVEMAIDRSGGSTEPKVGGERTTKWRLRLTTRNSRRLQKNVAGGYY
jgi:hypothetical protein